MANTKVTGDLIAAGTITATNIASGGLDSILSGYLTTNTYATESYVTTAVANLVDAAPSTLDTLNELAAALGDDPNFATTVTNSLASKIDGSGTANYIPKFIDTNTIGNSAIYEDSSGRVGIGTQVPLSGLNPSTYRGIEIDGTFPMLRGSNSGTDYFDLIGDATNTYLQSYGARNLSMYINGSERMRIDSLGNVGIGTSSPRTIFNIEDTYGEFLINDFGHILTRNKNYAQANEFWAISPRNSGNIDIGLGTLEPNNSINVSNAFFTINSSGNVGIGTSSPVSILDLGAASNLSQKITISGGRANFGYDAAKGSVGAVVISGSSAKEIHFETTSNTPDMIINSGGDVLIGTTSAGAFAGDNVVRFGSGGMISKSGSIANNSYLDIVVAGGGGYQGFLLVSNTVTVSANLRSQRTYSVFGRGTDGSIQQIASDNGINGAANFTVSIPSNGTIRVTNTSGFNCETYIQFFGGSSY